MTRPAALRIALTVSLSLALGACSTLTPAPPPPAAVGSGTTARTNSDVSIVRDVVYGHKEGMALIYDVLKPQKQNGAAVAFMVSGGWVSRWTPPEQRVNGFRTLLDRGFTVIAVEHGSSPRFKVPEAVADVRRAVRHIRQNAKSYGIDPERIGVTGGSAGGHLSLMLGLAADAGDASAQDPVLRVSDRVQAVVALYPPVDLRPMAGPSQRFPALDFPKEQAESVSPITFVTPDDPPTLLIHGDADQLVNINASKTIFAAFQQAKVTSEFVTIEGGAHGFPNPEHRQRAQSLMADWFEKYLGPQRAAAATGDKSAVK